MTLRLDLTRGQVHASMSKPRLASLPEAAPRGVRPKADVAGYHIMTAVSPEAPWK